MARIIRGPGVNSMSGAWAAAWLDSKPRVKIANISVFIGELLDDLRIRGGFELHGWREGPRCSGSRSRRAPHTVTHFVKPEPVSGSLRSPRSTLRSGMSSSAHGMGFQRPSLMRLRSLFIGDEHLLHGIGQGREVGPGEARRAEHLLVLL